MRRWISLAVAVAMMLPVAASVAEGAMATWLSPQQGQIVSGGRVEVSVGYNTGSNLKVTSVELYVDGQFYSRKTLRTPEVRGVCSFSWDTTRVEQGAHNLVVKVYAGDQVISKVYGTGTVGPNGIGSGMLDVRPPVVTFANIKAGDVIKGTKTIKMNAADDSGKDPMVSLMVDDNLKLLKNTAPYTYDLDSTTYSNGDHSLKTFAYDAAGNRSDPAVIKVEFRNGDGAPAVTTLSVKPDTESGPEPAKMSEAIPSSMAADSAPAIKGAARSVAHIAENSSAAPAVAAPEPKPVRIAASAPKAEPKVAEAKTPIKLAAPTLTMNPTKMASASASNSLRNAELKPALRASGSAAIPDIIAEPKASGVKSASAARLPSARATLMSAPGLAKGVQPDVPKVTSTPKPVVMASAKIAEPKHISMPTPAKAEPVRVSSAPKSSGPVKMAASQLPTSHKTVRGGVSSAAIADAPQIVADPTASSVKRMPIAQNGSVKPVMMAKATTGDAMAAAPQIVTPAAPKISKSTLKHVKVAMAPDFRTATKDVNGVSAISQPHKTIAPAKARIEKAKVPAKGKVKARSFFNDMGGVLFWNPTTHTVTACVQGMMIEMQIGSKAAKVNGHDFTMETAPYIVDGRTFIEARTYTQACSLLESLTTVGKAEVK